MIYDCFMFFNELDLLELRFKELYEVVDKFVIVEATQNHAGNTKPLHFVDNIVRFTPWLDKVIHIVVDDFPADADAWGRENFQRRALFRGLTDAQDDDIITVTDCDEIPRANVLRDYKAQQGLSCLEMPMSYYFMNCRGVDAQKIWHHAKIGPLGLMKKIDVCQLRYTQPNQFYVTENLSFHLGYVENAGWHFSFLGGVNAIREKIKSYCHQELNSDEFTSEKHIYEAIQQGKDLFDRGFKYELEAVNESYPRDVLMNLQHYRDLGFIAPLKRKVYDCFTFFNELDVLEIRLNELYPYVDKFILAEMTVTHTMQPKPLYFQENKKRFEKFLDKIEHIVIADFPTDPDPWTREHYQRDYIGRSLSSLEDHDVVIVSDVDEIPKGESISTFTGDKPLMYFKQRLYKGFLNADAGIPEPQKGVFSRITTMGYIRQKQLSLTGVRYEPISEDMMIPGGWHFSWINGGDGKNVLNKLLSYAHQEVVDRWIADGRLSADIRSKNISEQDVWAIENDIFNFKDAVGEDNLRIVAIKSEDFPQYVKSHENELLNKNLIAKQMANVAIVMPYYQGKELLAKSVKAIIAQEYQYWNLILVDDGSTEPATSCIEPDSRIIIVKQSNGGPSKARNTALRIIRECPQYQYIAFCDSDDRWDDKNYLLSQLYSLDKCDLTYSKVRKEFENGSPAMPFGISDPDRYPGLEELKRGNFIFISSVVMRRECLRVGDFDTKLDSIEDWDMWVRIAKEFYLRKNLDTEIVYTVKESGMAGQRTGEKAAVFAAKHANVEVTAYVSTKDRYFTTLPLALYAIANQTYPVKKIIIFDDGEHKDLRDVAPYREIFKLFERKKIEWFFFYGARKGQVANHNAAMEFPGSTEWLWRVDDDDTPEPDCLEKLVRNVADDVGAVGGLVHLPSQPIVPEKICSGAIQDIFCRLNLQWSSFKGVREVDHLHNTFLYRKSAFPQGYPRNLSPVGHREETIFSYNIKRAGWKVLIEPEALTWHLRDPKGGIRSHTSEQNYLHDESVFYQYLKDWGVTPRQSKLFILEGGLGDHICFKMILPEIKEKYPNTELLIANCYPKLFADDDVTMLSIDESKFLEDGQKHNIYQWCWDHGWRGTLVDAYRRLYL